MIYMSVTFMMVEELFSCNFFYIGDSSYGAEISLLWRKICKKLHLFFFLIIIEFYQKVIKALGEDMCIKC